MALTISTFDEALDLARGWVASEFPDENLSDDGYHGKWARVLAMLYWADQAALADASADWPPSDDSSTAALDATADLLGLSNGASGYGRLVATIATGGIGTITGALGTVYAVNSVLLGPDGRTRFELTTVETIPGAGPGTDTITTAPFSALTAGVAGNLLVGAQLQWSSPPAGNVGTVTLSTGLTGGTDSESNSALLERIRRRLKDPPRGGSANDWRSWGEAVAYRSYAYPLRGGSGTVHVTSLQSGSGQSRRIDSAATLASLTASFLANRPVTVEGYESFTGYMPDSSGMIIVARVTPTAGNEFDWDSSGVVRLVTAYTAVPPRLTFDVDPTAGFIADVNGGTPRRIQLVSAAGAYTLPQIVYVVAYNAGTNVATLANALTTAPAVNDIIHAGGPVVATVAADILAMVDALGPSKVSGYQDDGDGWDDTARIDELIRVALSSVDGTGARLLRDFVTDPTIDGAATNFQASDDGINPPGVLYIQSVAVTP